MPAENILYLLLNNATLFESILLFIINKIKLIFYFLINIF